MSEVTSTSDSVMAPEETNKQQSVESCELIEPTSTILSIKNEPTTNIELNESLTSIKVEENLQKEKNEPLVTKPMDKNENLENIMPKLEDEKAYKAWKKSITMVLSNITSHKLV
jgi:hypothetical protein